MSTQSLNKTKFPAGHVAVCKGCGSLVTNMQAGCLNEICLERGELASDVFSNPDALVEQAVLRAKHYLDNVCAERCSPPLENPQAVYDGLDAAIEKLLSSASGQETLSEPHQRALRGKRV